MYACHDMVSAPKNCHPPFDHNILWIKNIGDSQ